MAWPDELDFQLKTGTLMVGICDFAMCTWSVSLEGKKKKRQQHSLFGLTTRRQFAVHLGVMSHHFPSNNSSSLGSVQLADNTCGLHSQYQQTRIAVCKAAV